MVENIYWSQAQLVKRWQVSEGTLERWRAEGIGPLYLKILGVVVRYRQSDVSAFKANAFVAALLGAQPSPMTLIN